MSTQKKAGILGEPALRTTAASIIEEMKKQSSPRKYVASGRRRRGKKEVGTGKVYGLDQQSALLALKAR